MRLPSVICGVAIASLVACSPGGQQSGGSPPAIAQQSAESPFEQDGRLALALRGRQDPETAYVAIVLGPKGSETCAAITVPDKLRIPNPAGPGPKKLRIEWEVVNNCWSASGPRQEVSLSFGNPSPVQRWLKEFAEAPNPDPNRSGAENRDTIRASVKSNAAPRVYNYQIMLKIGDGPATAVVDPELEVEP
jgi:hypothetical protein